jgi:general secretion pathway protein A
MVYTGHFGLREAPFRATPDPRFFYSNAAYREAYATLLYGVLERKGFIVLTGEVGTGKTTLLRRLMDQLGAPVRFVLFYNTTLTFDETIELICAELGLPTEGSTRVQRLQRLNDLLIAEAQQGGHVVLLVDEAQNLGLDVLENLRLISNLETATEKLLQIVLVGQPELDAKLADPGLRPLAQRVAVRHRLRLLPDDEVEAFIDYRLRRCGRACRDLFTADAVRRVTVYANGVPRLINILCDAALLSSYGARMRRVTGAIVDEVAADLRLPARHASPVRRPPAATPGPGARADAAMPAAVLRWVAPGLAALAVAAMAGVAPFPGSLFSRLGTGSGLPSSGAGDAAAKASTRGTAASPAAPSRAAATPAAETPGTHPMAARTTAEASQRAVSAAAEAPGPHTPTSSASGAKPPGGSSPMTTAAAAGSRATRSADTEASAAQSEAARSPAEEIATAGSLAAKSRAAPAEEATPRRVARELPAAAVRRAESGAAIRGEAGRRDGWRMTVPEGATISEIVARRYGHDHLLALDLVKDLNPEIADLDYVIAGQPLWIPAFTLGTLARRQPDGSYELIVASLPTLEAASDLADRVRRSGYRAQVAGRDLSPGFRLHRVVVEGLDGLGAARRTWRTAQRLGWTPTVDTTTP